MGSDLDDDDEEEEDVNFDDVFNKRIPPPYFPTIVRVLS